MRFITQRSIRFITIGSTLANILFIVYIFLHDNVTITSVLLIVVFQFLILLFHFFGNTYFIWTNHQLNTIHELQLQNQSTISLDLAGLLQKQGEIEEQLRIYTKRQDEKIKSSAEALKILSNNLNEGIGRLSQFRGRLLEENNLLREQVSTLYTSQQEVVEELKTEITNVREALIKIIRSDIEENTGQIVNLVKVSQESIRHIREDSESGRYELQSLVKDNQEDLKNLVNELVSKNTNAIRYDMTTTYNRIDALFSIHRMITLENPLPIMSDWAISSDFGHFLLKQLLNNPGNVIDVGSGISTLLSGYALKKAGKGKVQSLEHDPVYFEKTKQLIREHNLEDYVELYYCPLRSYNINDESWQWYDISQVDFQQTVSLIVVDGPPGETQKMARFPAIPLLQKEITSKTLVLLDDAAREDEKMIAERWVNEYNMKCEFIKSHKGISVLSKER